MFHENIFTNVSLTGAPDERFVRHETYEPIEETGVVVMSEAIPAVGVQVEPPIQSQIQPTFPPGAPDVVNDESRHFSSAEDEASSSLIQQSLSAGREPRIMKSRSYLQGYCTLS
jgi:hypothetical protein